MFSESKWLLEVGLSLQHSDFDNIIDDNKTFIQNQNGWNNYFLSLLVFETVHGYSKITQENNEVLVYSLFYQVKYNGEPNSQDIILISVNHKISIKNTSFLL